MCEGAVAEVPQAWTAALAEGGGLGAWWRARNAAGKARLYTRARGGRVAVASMVGAPAPPAVRPTSFSLSADKLDSAACPLGRLHCRIDLRRIG